MKVIKIGAVWCSGCLVMRPRWQEIEKELPWLETKYYDYDENKIEIKKYKVESERLPVFIFLDERNKEILRMHGEISKETLMEKIEELKGN